MRFTVGVKIAGGFFLVTLMLLAAGGVGFNGAVKLGGAVDYFANSAWKSGESASRLVNSIQQQANSVGVISSGVTSIEDQQAQALKAFEIEASNSISTLRESGIATSEQLDQLATVYQQYITEQNTLLKSHTEYAENRQAAFADFDNFETFMKVFEFYSNNIYQLPNIDQGDKFELITYFFKTKLALQNRFYFMQRYLGGDDKTVMLDELDTALEELVEEAETLMELELTEAKIRSGEFQGNTYADFLETRVGSHEQAFTNLVASFEKFNEAKASYEVVKQTTLDQVAAILAHITSTVTDESDASASTKTGVYTTTIIAILVGVLIAIGATIFCVVTVVKPIVEIGRRMRDISSGDGDLTQTLPVKGNDEIAYVGKHFNTFVKTVRDIISETVQTADRLEASAVELQELSVQTTSVAGDQQAGSQQIAAALYEMVTSFQEVAENAANAETTTNQANESVIQSNQAVDSNLQAIDQLSSEIGEAKEVIMQLENESQSVAGILSVIQGIAEQTNLLALNAAIEAARAGEQGRGFAVVADEVRSLAQKTQQSTSEIQEVINSLKHKSEEAVQVINSSFTQAERSVDFAKQVTHHLGIVGESVGTVFEMNAQIATAAEQQAAVAEDINKNVTQINDLSAQTAQDAEKASASSKDVHDLVNGLSRIVGKFKI